MLTPPHILYTSRIEESSSESLPRSERRSGPSHVRRGQRTRQKSQNQEGSGLDGISNKAIKCFSSPLLALLVAIFNACLKIVTFRVWKDAVIIGIPKPETTRPPIAIDPSAY
ncbi:hypothetical protein EVAR_87722_1 [Eumeta japonica]|uniref:Uncharacterized protein n=1 Tax=Eumeta variegata TaxID=151549 RepID=A0A4C1TBB5_EUMVA|nr:hypothetical protein EVAR_87722_1 [Eumeta japonica]